MEENSPQLTELRRINKRLDVLIKIMLMSSDPDDKLAVAKKIQILNSVGLRYSEIGEILGIKASNVAVQLHKQRKKSAKKK